MLNRIAELKASYNKMKAQRRRDAELYDIDPEVAREFKPETSDEVAEELHVTTGISQHLGNGNRRIMPFILL